jgi:hypothetical protein
MPTTVPVRFSFPARTGIASGKPVRAHQIRSIGEGLVYLRGHSRVLIPCAALDYALPASTTHTYTIPVQRTSWMRHFEWRFALRSTTAVATVVFTDPTGGTSTHTVMPFDAAELPRVTWRQHTETLTGTTDTSDLAAARTFTFQRTDSNGGSVYVDGIQCTALGRAALEFDANDAPVDIATLAPDWPIASSIDYTSLGGVVALMRDQNDTTLHSYTDRHLFAWARPQGQGVAATSAWAAVFDEGPTIQASHRYIGETLRRVYVAATGRVTASGDTLEVRFTATSGDTATATVTATTSGTWSTHVALDVYAEDLSTSDGRRSSTDEIVTVETRVTGPGIKTGSLEGLVIYESRVAT